MNKMKKIVTELIEYIQALKYCLKLSWNASQYYTILRFFFEIAIPILVIINTFLGKYLINLFAEEKSDYDKYKLFIFLMSCVLLVNVLRNILSKVEQYVQQMHSNILNENIALLLMESAVNADLEYFDNTEYYDKLQASARDSNAIIQILWNALTFVGAGITFFSIFLVLWKENPSYGILLTVAIIPYTINSTKYTKLIYNLSIAQISEERKKNYIQGLTLDKRYSQDIRLFNIGKFLRDKHYYLWKNCFKKKKNIIYKKTLIAIFFYCFPEIVSIGIVVGIGFKIFIGDLTIGDYSLYTGLIAQFLSSFSTMVSAFINIYDNKLRIINLKSIFGIKNTILNNGTLELNSVESIEFEHVDFTYPNTELPVLKDICITLRKDEKVAFVGINGSGKSTLIKLILRMYDPQKGSIKINGIDIKRYRLESLRKNFSVYFQEMNNYCFSLLENIVIGDIECFDAKEDINESLKASCCQDILEKASNDLSNNLMRIFDAKGIELSGGQHQKLALARALFRRNTALILDEPSSNLDPKAEYHIFKNLKKLTNGKMTIFISHRLSNISLADRIIVLENGVIIEDGNQKQLLKNNEHYAELFRYQSEKFQIF